MTAINELDGSGRAALVGAQRRILSFTFDDGLANGTETACEILHSFGLTGTFYIVTGWVEPVRAIARERWNAGRWHGDWGFWRRIRDSGHEVGSHSFSHVNMGGKKARLLPWIVPRELALSLRDLVRHVPQTNYTISMPWNSATARSERLVSSFFSACRLGSTKLEYNHLEQLDVYKLRSWAPGPETTVDEYKRAFEGIPENGWLIVQFHSLDEEGWQPLSRATLTKICSLAAEVSGLEVQTVAETAVRFASKAGPDIFANSTSGNGPSTP